MLIVYGPTKSTVKMRLPILFDCNMNLDVNVNFHQFVSLTDKYIRCHFVF